jgi:hypothetical protein
MSEGRQAEITTPLAMDQLWLEVADAPSRKLDMPHNMTHTQSFSLQDLGESG